MGLPIYYSDIFSLWEVGVEHIQPVPPCFPSSLSCGGKESRNILIPGGRRGFLNAPLGGMPSGESYTEQVQIQTLS